MTITLEKTWEFKLGTYVSGNSDGFLKAKNLLKSFPTHPWTVWGSGNRLGSVSNGTGVDYWNSISDITYSSSSSYSWIVLQQPALGAKTAFMLAYNNPNTAQANVVFSPVNGFGAANGGADGTTGVAPTATDGFTVPYLNVAGFYSPSYLHAMMSTDGLSTRLFAFSGALTTLWMFERPKNPVGVLSTSIIACAQTAGDLMASWADTNYQMFRTRLASGSLAYGVPTSEGYYEGSTLLGKLAYPDDQSAEWPLCPQGLFFLTTNHRGRKCELYDFWRCSAPVSTPMPDSGSRQVMSLGGIVVPWDGASNLVWR